MVFLFSSSFQDDDIEETEAPLMWRSNSERKKLEKRTPKRMKEACVCERRVSKSGCENSIPKSGSSPSWLTIRGLALITPLLILRSTSFSASLPFSSSCFVSQNQSPLHFLSHSNEILSSPCMWHDCDSDPRKRWDKLEFMKERKKDLLSAYSQAKEFSYSPSQPVPHHVLFVTELVLKSFAWFSLLSSPPLTSLISPLTHTYTHKPSHQIRRGNPSFMSRFDFDNLSFTANTSCVQCVWMWVHDNKHQKRVNEAWVWRDVCG